jgi:hypothetical protein
VSCVPVQEQAVSAPKPYMNNRFAVLSAPDSADEENQNEAEFQEQEAGKPLKAASLDGLEDKPKAPICAAQMITIEDPVPVLNYVLVEEIEMRDEAKFQLEDPKLLDIKDKVQADTALKVP